MTRPSNLPPDRLLHRLWTKAVGTPDYDKAEWLALERALLGRTATSDPPLMHRSPATWEGHKGIVPRLIDKAGEMLCLVFGCLPDPRDHDPDGCYFCPRCERAL